MGRSGDCALVQADGWARAHGFDVRHFDIRPSTVIGLFRKAAAGDESMPVSDCPPDQNGARNATLTAELRASDWSIMVDAPTSGRMVLLSSALILASPRAYPDSDGTAIGVTPERFGRVKRRT